MGCYNLNSLLVLTRVHDCYVICLSNFLVMVTDSYVKMGIEMILKDIVSQAL